MWRSGSSAEAARRAALAAAGLVAVAASPAPAAGFDAALYAQLLERHTREVPDTAGVRVDYRGLRGSADWGRLIASLERAEPPPPLERDAHIAFFVNAYNVLAIQVVLRGYPLESIRDAGSLIWPVWKRTAGRIGGEEYTLDQIEHEILRPLGEPRIHAAIVCASTSCPSLYREPFDAARLDAQLDRVVRAWLADPRKGLRLDRRSGTLHLSRIFEWFEEDFAAAGGVLAFARRYADPEVAAWLEAHPDRVRIEYFEYDWALNDLADPAGPRPR